jgi:hypothetical protein
VKPNSDSRQAGEHVKKQEQPQTHEDREAQKLVERIEKKVKEKPIREDSGQAWW